MSEGTQDTRSMLKSELKIIAPVGWLIAGVVLVLWLSFILTFIVQHEREKAGGPELPLWILQSILIVAGVILSIWVLMVFYVNADAARRHMNRVLWTLLVIFIPNAIGFIVYFLLRRPVAQLCGKCKTALKPEFVFCPVCGQEAAPKCPACGHAVEPGWASCAFCGAQLESSGGPAPLPNY